MKDENISTCHFRRWPLQPFCNAHAMRIACKSALMLGQPYEAAAGPKRLACASPPLRYPEPRPPFETCIRKEAMLGIIQ